MTSPPQPILLVHGIWDSGRNFEKMRAALLEAGAPRVDALSMTPNDGSAPIDVLAQQVDAAVTQLLDETGAAKIDLVGFSMGALVTRCWLQRLDGRARTRRYIAISGPQNGTHTAWFMRKAGVKQMRPKSDLLRELTEDPEPFPNVDVHVFYTPFDLMILPPLSATLPGATLRRFNMPLHRMMITHRKVIAAVIETFAA